MLELWDVSRVFENGNTAFREITFTAQKGEIIGVLGTSGCGKSSLLRVIAGLDQASTGRLVLNGSEGEEISKKVGVIFQEPRLMPWLSVIENVAFGLKGREAEKKEKASRFIKLVGLEGFENHYPRQLSGGMAQRVAIARSLVTRPEILLLDEPFSALDAFTKMQLQDLLLKVWEDCGSTMIMVTHDIDEALYLCDRLLVMRGQPGVLSCVVDITQLRPRTRGNAELARQKQQILDILDITGKAG
ncbi:ABC transporter ATP-binding protein [Aneurinibacillus danicus]|uniref:Nitrate/sulfonate/bicarbonate ABC transporter ATP-binding protein n=1 Tax=Aneurinibacillus danicus TaxID=267746 RepID=A0A511VAZ4_9BACL|nr:ABC transporter ATP-binding protein [Aneurinibacillus danicus]GEN34412.1 nitrate/sulfonate/bicarbonate ABC transporter ATP-binding protein [Aneurinibacillus danicus]